AFTSSWWEKQFGSPWCSTALRPSLPSPGPSSGLAWLCFGATFLILAQLILGATMRHQHAGLAIPDFPLAYGGLSPALDPHAISLALGSVLSLVLSAEIATTHTVSPAPTQREPEPSSGFGAPAISGASND